MSNQLSRELPVGLTAYQRRIIDREAERLCARLNREAGHPKPHGVYPLMDTLGRWPFRLKVAAALGLTFTLADWTAR